VNGTITRYTYDGPNILLEYDGQNNIKSSYLHNLAIDDPLAVEQGGKVYYYQKDALGSVVALTNESGQIVQSYEYDSFGKLINQTGSIRNPFTYTGREYDEETALYYYRARYYDPKADRFLTRDPIGFAGGDANLYRYVDNNPLNWTDSFGLWSPITHDFIFKFSFLGKLSDSDIARLQLTSRRFDRETAQTAYKHSMRQNESIEEANKARNRFIKDTLKEARALAQSGNRDAALDKFAEAGHTISDATCPVHVDRDGNPRKFNPWWPFRHSYFDILGAETLKNLPFETLKDLKNKLNNAYDEVFGP
jgi:RHS repeat-associated protein